MRNRPTAGDISSRLPRSAIGIGGDRPLAGENFYDVLPAFKIRTIGKKSYTAVNRRLSSLDLGEAFKKEWAERIRRLKEYLVASEAYHKSLLYQFGGTNDDP